MYFRSFKLFKQNILCSEGNKNDLIFLLPEQGTDKVDND